MARLVWVLGIIPQNFISFLVGWFVRLRWPEVVQKQLNQIFSLLFRLDMSESLIPIESFQSIENVFIRELKPDLRPTKGAFVSSADGVLERSAPVANQNEAIQAKGLNYSLSDLVTGKPDGEIAAKWFTTIYLAPHNYHRVHSPVSGRVIGMRYIPGRLWPVNKPAVLAIPRLFTRNERLVFDMELEDGGKVWLVMVGALNVGRMTTKLDPEFVTNSAIRSVTHGWPIMEKKMEQPVPVRAGDELGVFMLGSTTVTVLDEEAQIKLQPKECSQASKVFVGENLSQI